MAWQDQPGKQFHLEALMRIDRDSPKLTRSRVASRFFHWPLALLFLYSGAIKLFRLPQFAQTVGDFGIVLDSFVQPTALMVCVIELGIAYALFQQKTWSMLATAILILGFLGVLSYGLAIGLDIECGCFGSGYKLKLREQLVVDLMLLPWCACGHFFSNNVRGRNDP